jgi:hypothetical protein
LPLSSVAVVPVTKIRFPTLTAREYPTIGSHLAFVENTCRAMPGIVAAENDRYRSMLRVVTSFALTPEHC